MLEYEPQPLPGPLVEVLDEAQRVVAVMPEPEVVRQKLVHRAMAILIFDDQGRLSLRRGKKKATSTGRWDVPVRGPVLAGESVQDAASRALTATFGTHSERLRPLLELPAQPENGNVFLHVFSLNRSENRAEAQVDGANMEPGDYSFTTEELGCLLRDFRDLVSPRFLLLAEALNAKGLWRRRS